MTGKSKPYCELGKLLDNLARDRAVRGPYNIAAYLKDAADYEVSGQAISKYLYGHSQPKQEFVGVFAEVSPECGWATPTAAASTTPGYSASTSSTSAGKTLNPETMMRSLARSTM